jgi:hypothetical protein
MHNNIVKIPNKANEPNYINIMCTLKEARKLPLPTRMVDKKLANFIYLFPIMPYIIIKHIYIYIYIYIIL